MQSFAHRWHRRFCPRELNRCTFSVSGASVALVRLTFSPLLSDGVAFSLQPSFATCRIHFPVHCSGSARCTQWSQVNPSVKLLIESFLSEGNGISTSTFQPRRSVTGFSAGSEPPFDHVAIAGAEDYLGQEPALTDALTFCGFMVGLIVCAMLIMPQSRPCAL